jgi:hypothetical protein
MSNTPRTYIRSSDNAVMIEVAKEQFVAVKAALALKPVTKEYVDAACIGDVVKGNAA